MDPFLASMTFAGGVERECDCDECDSCGLSMVPPDIKNAIRDYKRRKVMSIIDFSRQERNVIARSENGCLSTIMLSPGVPTHWLSTEIRIASFSLTSYQREQT